MGNSEDLNELFQNGYNTIAYKKNELKLFRHESIDILKPIVDKKCRQYGVKKIDKQFLFATLVCSHITSTTTELQKVEDSFKAIAGPLGRYTTQDRIMRKYLSPDELEPQADALIRNYEYYSSPQKSGNNEKYREMK